MNWQPAPRPRWVADQIAIGELIGPLTLHPLRADVLLDTAITSCGVSDFGGDSWRVGFEQLCAALIDDADLHAVGAALVRSELLRTLMNRLRIVAGEPAGPIAAEVLEPWFVCGTARSGTSILHELLALDPSVRAPRAWEVMYSTPVPEVGNTAPDTRVSRADREVKYWEAIAPEYLTMHENGGALPQECIFITAHEFASEHWSGVHDVPSYNKWLRRADLTPAYLWHRRHLQWLQAGRNTQWALKAPSHLSALPALFSVYPDAWIIQTHRDPMRTVPSTISLMATLRWMRSDHVDVRRLATTMATGVASLFDWVTAMRSDGTLRADRFIDVRYAELMRDPVSTLRGVYQRIGHEFTDQHALAITRYLASKPKSKHGTHRYALADFDLEETELAERYRGYCETFAIEREDD
jgi:hypothetical protein